MNYRMYIKSHTDAPDWEHQVFVDSEDEAVEMFYKILQGEYDRDFIRENMEGGE